jgi:hypothetical protein
MKNEDENFSNKKEIFPAIFQSVNPTTSRERIPTKTRHEGYEN